MLGSILYVRSVMPASTTSLRRTFTTPITVRENGVRVYYCTCGVAGTLSRSEFQTKSMSVDRVLGMNAACGTWLVPVSRQNGWQVAPFTAGQLKEWTYFIRTYMCASATVKDKQG